MRPIRGKTPRRFHRWHAVTCCLSVVAWVCSGLCLPATSVGETLVLKSGFELNGTLGKIPSLDNHALAAIVGGDSGGGSNLIYVVDDGLRRTFVSTYQVQGPRDDVETIEMIRIKQAVARSGKTVGRVGGIAKAGPFDEFGRRQVLLRTSEGMLPVIQGITKVTPRFTQVEGLKAGAGYVWDMRIATSSIPRATLSQILQTHLDKNSAEDRLKIVRLYLQSERYQDAETELKLAIEQLPDLGDLSEQLRNIRQLGAEQRLNELKVRRDAGQHQLVRALIPKFPSEGVAGELLLEVQDLQTEYDRKDAEIKFVLDTVAALVEEFGENDFFEELKADLNYNNLTHLTDFLRLARKDEMEPEQKLAVAMSSWLTGGKSRENLAVGRSMWRARQLVMEYLQTETDEPRRRILNDLRSEEAGLVSVVAQLLAALSPPRAPGQSDADQQLIRTSEWVPGLMQITVPGVLKGRELTYHIQLPPEYDPYRRYPAVVTLRGSGTTTEQQIDWWAGTFNQQVQLRTGPAARKGYIVIAPEWARTTQNQYEFTANEHAAVLTTLRDAMSRFAIDSNRVFLSGHSMGGDAAWDIGLAHPDLWAGVVPISAVAAHGGKRDPKYITLYWENARMVPLYFVGGSKDTERLSLNSRDFDRYLKRPYFDTQIVEYLGRGHEHFQDEIHRIFDWMEVHERDFLPTEFEAMTMRPWDSFFWWLEIDGLPPNSTVLPHDWPKGGRPLPVKGKVSGQSDVRVTAGVKNRITVFLAPPLVDFANDVTVYVSNRRRARSVQPELKTILEDARTRHDRQQAFWAKVAIELTRQRP